MTLVTRYKILIEYNGTTFNGWEGNTNSVRHYIEHALLVLFKQKIILYCGGRTDTGVHAIGQVAHFDAISNMEENKITQALNYYINNINIRIKSCSIVTHEFHARYNAIEKHYKYLITTNLSTLYHNMSYYVYKNLNIILMQEAIQHLIGKHDFSTFCPRQFSGLRVRTINNATIDIENNIFDQCISINFWAKSFMHHQVRNMVGGLLSIGLGTTTINEFINKVHAKNRNTGWVTAPPQGLYLVSIKY